MSAEQGDVEVIREALSSPFRDGWRDALAALDRLAAALAENKQAWEDMRAYNIRLEERAREAERALAEMTERVERELKSIERWAGEQNAGNAFAEQVRYWALSKLAALRPSEDTSDES